MQIFIILLLVKCYSFYINTLYKGIHMSTNTLSQQQALFIFISLETLQGKIGPISYKINKYCSLFSADVFKYGLSVSTWSTTGFNKRNIFLVNIDNESYLNRHITITYLQYMYKNTWFHSVKYIQFLHLFFMLLTFVRSVWSFVFSPLPQRPMTSDFEGFSIPDFIHHIYYLIKPVFSLFNVQC